ncbi:hypothetical protein [Mangrovimonas aestuarii]|uniref:hypothetical protein n=1 Tax=Mangrovimonas aestuarii TaxID=3018443 RepID=UPI002378681A|nr:hypothetical protein [Mangrovimonas aestuarii]
MKRFLFLGLFSTVLLFSCKDETNQSQIDIEQNIVTVSITAKDIDSISYNEYILDAPTLITLKGWDRYFELKTNIDQLKTGDVSFFYDNSDAIKTLIEGLKSGLPKQGDTPAVRARLTALENMILKLESSINQHNSTKIERINNIKEVLVAFSNLNLQINKKFEKESQNIQKPQ